MHDIKRLIRRLECTNKVIPKRCVKFGGFYLVVYPTPTPQPDPRDGYRIGTGGDRMFHHGYAVHYERFLKPYVENRDQRFVVVEVGILNGTGLAIWCDLFPYSRCIGLDINISNIQRNMDNLLALGAFGNNSPELYEYDQLVDSTELLGDILNDDRIDIFIDDGAHFGISPKSYSKVLCTILTRIMKGPICAQY